MIYGFDNYSSFAGQCRNFLARAIFNYTLLANRVAGLALGLIDSVAHSFGNDQNPQHHSHDAYGQKDGNYLQPKLNAVSILKPMLPSVW